MFSSFLIKCLNSVKNFCRFIGMSAEEIPVHHHHHHDMDDANGVYNYLIAQDIDTLIANYLSDSYLAIDGVADDINTNKSVTNGSDIKSVSEDLSPPDTSATTTSNDTTCSSIATTPKPSTPPMTRSSKRRFSDSQTPPQPPDTGTVDLKSSARVSSRGYGLRNGRRLVSPITVTKNTSVGQEERRLDLLKRVGDMRFMASNGSPNVWITYFAPNRVAIDGQSPAPDSSPYTLTGVIKMGAKSERRLGCSDGCVQRLTVITGAVEVHVQELKPKAVATDHVVVIPEMTHYFTRNPNPEEAYIYFEVTGADT